MPSCGFGSQRGSACDAELGVDVGEVGLDGVAADEELLRDLRVGQPASDGRCHLELDRSEARPAMSRFRSFAATTAGVVDRLVQ